MLNDLFLAKKVSQITQSAYIWKLGLASGLVVSCLFTATAGNCDLVQIPIEDGASVDLYDPILGSEDSVQFLQVCNPSNHQYQSEFVITGRGGLPPSPQEALSTDSIVIDWVSLNPNVTPEGNTEQIQENLPDFSSVEANNTTTSKPIVEAQGWVTISNGKIVLIAQNADTSNPSFLPHSCTDSKN